MPFFVEFAGVFEFGVFSGFFEFAGAFAEFEFVFYGFVLLLAEFFELGDEVFRLDFLFFELFRGLLFGPLHRFFAEVFFYFFFLIGKFLTDPFFVGLEFLLV
ncbi:MAG: hypothetical protein QG650_1124, partial [Patescibacteria group bacterium]|nr:hypothetical protein [Patescibacteria group bacterium]